MKVLIRLSSLESKVAKAIDRQGKKVEGDIEGEMSLSNNMQRPHRVEVSVEPAPDSICTEDEKFANVENAVLMTRAKVQECLNLVASFKSPAIQNHPSYLDSIQYLENCLSEVKNVLEKCCGKGNDAELNVSNGSSSALELVRHTAVQCVVGKLENLLQTKLKEIAARKSELVKLGRFDGQARMQLLAEKLAYESVLIGRIVQAATSCEDTSSSFRKRVLDSEIVECRRLILELKSKLKGTAEAKSSCYETSLEHLTRVLSARLIAQTRLASSRGFVTQKSEVGWSLKPGSTDAIETLLKQQEELQVCMKTYRGPMLQRLAQSLATETLCLTNVEQQGFGRSATRTLEDRRIREAWTLAQETVNRELIQAEISHVTMRCGQVYETSLALEQEAIFSFLASQHAVLEQWSDTVEGILRQEMESGIDELATKYEECLSNLKKDKSVISSSHGEEAMLESRRLLSEFADMTAHKALVDARIAVICNETPPMDSPDISITNEVVTNQQSEGSDVISRLLADPGQDEFRADSVMRMEFQFLFEQFLQKCHSNLLQVFNKKTVVSDECVRSVMDTLVYLQRELQTALDKCNIHQDGTGTADCDTKACSWDAVCSKCSTLRLQMTSLVKCILQGRDCHSCQQLQQTVRR
jgi:hypothetical protein